MRLARSWLVSLGISAALLSGCGSNDDGPQPGGSAGSGGGPEAGVDGADAAGQPDTLLQDAAGEASDPDGSADAAEGGHADGEADGAADDAVADADASEPEEAGADAELEPDAAPKAHLRLSFNHDWIWTQVERDTVKVQCTLFDAQGVAQPAPADLAISVAEPSAVKKGAAEWAFPNAGVYPVQCSSSSLGMVSSRELVVSWEGFDYRFVRVAQALGEYDAIVQRLLETNAAGDPVGYGKAVSDLQALGSKLPNTAGLSFVVSNPNGWPSDQQLAGAGFVAGPKDADWVAKLEALRAAVVAERTALNALSSPPTDAEAKALKAAYAETAARRQALGAVTPSAFVVWKELSKVGALVAELGETTRVRAAVLAPLFLADPPLADAGQKPMFSLVETLASIAIEELLGSYSYEAMLKDVGKVAVASIISIAIKDLINSHLPLGANAPQLDSVHGSAMGFCGQGIPFTAVGSFNPVWSKNRIIFIPPKLSLELAGIVDVVDGLNGITQEDNILKLVNNIRKVLEDLIDLYKAAWGANSQFISLTPSSGDGMFLEFPALPKGLNCNSYSLPVAGTMIPLDFDYGRGLAINVNVLGEPMSNCQ